MVDLKIKNYYPLDHKEDAQNPRPNVLNIHGAEGNFETKPKNTEEEREFAVGLITLICIAIFLIVFFLIKINLNKNTDTAQSQPQNQTESTQQPQVAGNSTNNSQTQNKSSQSNSTNSTATQNTKSTNTDSTKSYTIQSGDTLYAIAKKYNIDWHKIADLNQISSATALKVGQKLSIPAQ